MTMVINNDTKNTLNGKYIVSTELYNKILKAMDDGQVIVFHGKLTNYESFQYAIATPFVLQLSSSEIPVPSIWLAMQYFTIGISDDGNEPFRITSVRFVITSDPTEEAELYEPQNFDILGASLSGGGGEK